METGNILNQEDECCMEQWWKNKKCILYLAYDTKLKLFLFDCLLYESNLRHLILRTQTTLAQILQEHDK